MRRRAEADRVARLKAELARTRNPWRREQIENELDRIAEDRQSEREEGPPR